MNTSSGSVSLQDESELSSARAGAVLALPKSFGPSDLLEETGVATVEISVEVDEAAAGKATSPGPGLTSMVGDTVSPSQSFLHQTESSSRVDTTSRGILSPGQPDSSLLKVDIKF